MPEAGPGRGTRSAAAAMTGVFLLSAAVQWNDPDPVRWMALYTLAAALAGLAAAGRLPLVPNAAALVLFAILTALWAPSVLDARREAFTSFRMREAADEEPREAGGLLVCLVWSAVQTWQAARLRAAP